MTRRGQLRGISRATVSPMSFEVTADEPGLLLVEGRDIAVGDILVHCGQRALVRSILDGDQRDLFTDKGIIVVRSRFKYRVVRDPAPADR